MSTFTPSGTTGVVAVIGDPVRHSLSPALHNAAYRALGVDLAYVAFTPRRVDVASALRGAAALGFVGLSVTTPHKDAVALACDQRSRVVERLGAANTVLFAQGVSVAHSTDGEGLLGDLAAAFGFAPAGRRCAVLGAGGAARAVILALGGAGAAEVLVVNRTRARAVKAAELAGAAGRVGEEGELAGLDLVLNATSVGLSGDAASNAHQAALGATLRSGQLCLDLVYHPARTAFLDGAARAGATIRNGLGMLVHQAARQVELFSGEPAPLEAMWAAVEGRPTS